MNRIFKRGTAVLGVTAMAIAMAVSVYAATNSSKADTAPNRLGMVTEITDDTVTIEVGGPMGGNDRQQPAEGETPPAKPEGETLAEGETPPAKPTGEKPTEGETPPAKPEGESLAEGETPPAKPEGDAQASQKETLTVSTDLISGTIEVGDMVVLTLDSEGAVTAVAAAEKPADSSAS